MRTAVKLCNTARAWRATRPSPNLRQVHLLQAELFESLAALGHSVGPGDMGENVSTQGLDLLALPVGTELHLGPDAVVRLTGLRNPCVQIDRFQHGLMAAVLDRTPQGELIRKAGVMAVVLRGGVVSARDRIEVRLPAGPHAPLKPGLSAAFQRATAASRSGSAIRARTTPTERTPAFSTSGRLWRSIPPMAMCGVSRSSAA